MEPENQEKSAFSSSTTTKKKTISRKWLKRIGLVLLISLLLLVLFLLGFSYYIDHYCLSQPPAYQPSPKVLKQQVKRNGKRRKIGTSWFFYEKGLHRMYLEGSSFEMGYYHAKLTQDLLKEQEKIFLDKIHEYVPSSFFLWLLRKYVTWHNRNLNNFVPLNLKIEILGLSMGQPNFYPELGPLYNRILNYHAAHDISHLVMDTPLVGCTSFAAWGKATQNGHLLLARNFDFNLLDTFDQNKVVTLFRPKKGYAFLSVGWAGMIGVVSGINEKKIAVTVNGAQSEDHKGIGTPVSLLVRQVLQQASTLDEAVSIIQKAKVFVSDLYLIADGKIPRALVVEKTPSRSSVWEVKGDYLVSANHFLSPTLKNDRRNLAYKKEGTSSLRFQRMKHLVKKYYSSLTPQKAAEILRDRWLEPLQKETFLNPGALNSMIATHSVIMDVTEGILWVSKGPHQMGSYVPFSIDSFDHPIQSLVIPPDPLFQDQKRFAQIQKAKKLLHRSRLLIRDNRKDQAIPLLKQAYKLDSTCYLGPYLLGRIFMEKKEYPKALKWLQICQSLYPPFDSERKQISTWLSELKKL
ncbi:MAG: hypothetical protein D6785_05070 [Planctomycetota bacterium]|nr:MAG: hypothetical protein D6785_05070 [Planctomycetota bacterium]